ncbi:MAG: hypothetical protein ABSA10_02370 [Anaerolineales bacterium]|jgi:hypothetical protein
MNKIAIDGPRPPIGFLSSLWKGIEFVNAHPGIMVVPVLIDAFLWFGPHLSLIPLINPVLTSLNTALAANQLNPTMMDALRQAVEKYNLFSLLAFIPLFPPSLMTGAAPGQTPLGTPIVISIANWWQCLGIVPALIASSILIGSLYWLLAGRSAQGAKWTRGDWFARYSRTVIVMLLLCGTFLVLILGISIPVLFVISVIGVVSADFAAILSQLFFFLGGGFLFWVFLFFIFSVHGIILFRDGILQSIRNSVVTSRWLYPISIWIPILLILLQYLVSMVWALASDANWSGAVGILGNAYTSSVIVTASMAYYIDKRRWISEIQSQLQTRMAVKPPTTGV